MSSSKFSSTSSLELVLLSKLLKFWILVPSSVNVPLISKPLSKDQMGGHFVTCNQLSHCRRGLPLLLLKLKERASEHKPEHPIKPKKITCQKSSLLG